MFLLYVIIEPCLATCSDAGNAIRIKFTKLFRVNLYIIALFFHRHFDNRIQRI